MLAILVVVDSADAGMTADKEDAGFLAAAGEMREEGMEQEMKDLCTVLLLKLRATVCLCGTATATSRLRRDVAEEMVDWIARQSDADARVKECYCAEVEGDVTL